MRLWTTLARSGTRRVAALGSRARAYRRWMMRVSRSGMRVGRRGGQGSVLLSVASTPLLYSRDTDDGTPARDRITEDAVVAAKPWFNSFWLFIHGARLLAIFLPCLVAFMFSRIGLIRPAVVYKIVVKALTLAGPTFIKLGQWGSTRPDLFPISFCLALQELRADTSFHSMKHTETTLREELGISDLSSVFESIDEPPLHAGCAGQIHKAKLRRNAGYKPFEPEPSPWYTSFWSWVMRVGRRKEEGEGDRVVAVKVLHPKIREMFQRDMELMLMVGRMFERLPGTEWFAVQQKLLQYKNFIEDQLDLRLEGYSLQKFVTLFQDDPTVEFPRPYPGLTAPSVLVESFIDGQNLDAWTLTASEDERKKVARAGLRTFLSMLFVHNYTHSDLHPGNIMVTQRGGLNRLVYVDAGLVTQLSNTDWRNFVELYAAVVAGDASKAANLMIERSPHHQCETRKEYVEGMGRVIKRFNFTASLAAMNVGSTLQEILNLSREHKVMLDSPFTSLMIAIVVLEGVGMSLDPDINIVTESIPSVIRWITTRPSAVKDVLPALYKTYTARRNHEKEAAREVVKVA